MTIIITVNWENITAPNVIFARPKLDYAVTNVHLDRGISLRMEGRQFRIKSHGFYNVYNILAAYAAARTAGFYLERFDQSAAQAQNAKRTYGTV